MYCSKVSCVIFPMGTLIENLNKQLHVLGFTQSVSNVQLKFLGLSHIIRTF
jgi:hypothetical protein